MKAARRVRCSAWLGDESTQGRPPEKGLENAEHCNRITPRKAENAPMSSGEQRGSDAVTG